MKIENTFPPIFEQANNVFALNKDVIYTYGDTIYNPGGHRLQDHVIAHEEVHMHQQGEDPAAWWNRYLEDEEFRFNQELEAYQAQYKFFASKEKDRNNLFRFLNTIAGFLSGDLYSNITSKAEAMRLIKQSKV